MVSLEVLAGDQLCELLRLGSAMLRVLYSLLKAVLIAPPNPEAAQQR